MTTPSLVQSLSNIDEPDCRPVKLSAPERRPDPLRKTRPMKAVFDVKPGSGYDDDIVRRYHFPATAAYMKVAQATLGDWIIYREPKRNGGRQAYVAAARVVRLEIDKERGDRCYAHVDGFIPFPRPVGLLENGRYREERLRRIADRRLAGRELQGHSLRAISDADFDSIVEAALGEIVAPENARRLGLDEGGYPVGPGIAMGENSARRTELLLINRKIRDANFRLQICEAYYDRCAVTGLRIINGGGRSEVQAAHILPVAEGGPDIVQNGMALSATVHWLFDRHLISISDDHRLLVSHNRVPRELQSLFKEAETKLYLPKDKRLWPHRNFLAHHRERFAGYAS